MKIRYQVIDTPMWPCRWKVVPINSPDRDNSWTEYFEHADVAQAECDRRNESI